MDPDPVTEAPARARWIDDPAQLRPYLESPPTRIGLDTEFIRERTFWPRLALVQVAIGDDILLVDPLVPGMTEALVPLLGDPDVLKIVHSPSEDLVAFKHGCAMVPKPLFDTQLAAALVGIGGGLGYQKLVEQITGVTLGKGETRSDWLRRPLSAAQLEYAADDVRHLFELHDALDGQLGQLGRREWLAQDTARAVCNAESEGPERWPHRSLRSAQRLDRAAQLRLLRLLRWRDRHAREHDRPRNWVLDNELAVTIARADPADRDALQRQLDAHPKAPRKLGHRVWAALSTPLPDESEAPVAAAHDPVEKQRLRALQDAVATRSTELGLPDGVLASRRWLEALLQHGQWPDALSGWRRDALEPVLRPLLVPTGQ